MISYYNGSFISNEDISLKSSDRGFLLGDGLFETIPAYNGHIFGFTEHWERLEQGLKTLNFNLKLSPDTLLKAMERLLHDNNLSTQRASLRVTVTRGTGPRGLLPPAAVEPTILITVAPFNPVVHDQFKLIIASARRNEFSLLSNIKSLNYLDNVLAKMEAQGKNADDAIFLNTRGNVACTSAANIFMIKQGMVITPKLDQGILPGVTRKKILELCDTNKIGVEEGVITLAMLQGADEIFLTNSLIEIQGVTQVEDKMIGQGKLGRVTLNIRNLYLKECCHGPLKVIHTTISKPQ